MFVSARLQYLIAPTCQRRLLSYDQGERLVSRRDEGVVNGDTYKTFLYSPPPEYLGLPIEKTNPEKQVQQGADLLTSPDQEELMLLSRGNLPVRWRLSCKVIVGKENKAGTVRLKAVPQAEWRSQARQ